MKAMTSYLMIKLETLQLLFIWNGNMPKIKRITLRNSYKNDTLQNVDVILEVISIEIFTYPLQ